MAVPFGKYQLLRKIASGGMGQVFLALERSTGFERLVVLKLILPHLAENDEFLAMFLEEARLVAPLRHPNLVAIHDQQEIEGRYCLVMEYVQGEDVRRLEKFARTQGKPLSTGLALRIIAEAAAGLDYAHQARDPQDGKPLRLVHRDVSPQNILVGFDGGVKVIDFGVAKAAGSASHTATGVLKGKYPYMSPEQAGGQPVDGRSDQFALGVVLWELLTNRRLFKGESDLMTLRLVRDCQVPPPSQLNPALPPELDALVLRALAPTPEGRFPDCGAFRLAIEDYLLQQRLPASNAHLSAWLRELYAERIASEADPTNLDQLTEDTDLDSNSNSARGSARSVSQQSPPPAPPPPSSTGTPIVPAPRSPSGNTKHTRTLPPGTVSRRRFPMVPVAGVGALLIAAGAAFVFLRQASVESTPPVTAPVEGRAQARPLRPELAREPQPVMLQVLSEPAGARVEVDGEQRGETPVDLWLAPDAPPVMVAWQLEGYQPVSRRVSAEDAPQVSVTLTPKKPPRRNTGSQLGIKTDR
jgi:serine/threonine-protein kinase